MMHDAFQSLSLKDRVVIVTGAASGIGRSAATLIAERGAAVVLADVSAAGEQLANEIRTAGGQAAFIRVDISHEPDVEAMVRFAVSEFGGLHGAFNNAGVLSKGTSLDQMPLAEWQRVIDVNLTGPFLCMKHEIAYMLENGGGSIVNTASGSGVVASPNMVDYVASKHGVVGLTRSAALDFSARGIRTNALLPGGTETPMLASALEDPAVREIMARGHPIGRLGRPIDMAEGAAWLLSDAAAFVTGLCMTIDGGYTAA